MPSNGDDGEGDWFIYDQRAGRFTARPVSLAGWGVFLLAIAVPASFGLLIGPHLLSLHPLIFGASLGTIIAADVLLLVWIAKRRGRRAP